MRSEANTKIHLLIVSCVSINVPKGSCAVLYRQRYHTSSRAWFVGFGVHTDALPYLTNWVKNLGDALDYLLALANRHITSSMHVLRYIINFAPTYLSQASIRKYEW